MFAHLNVVFVFGELEGRVSVANSWLWLHSMRFALTSMLAAVYSTGLNFPDAWLGKKHTAEFQMCCIGVNELAFDKRC